MQAECVEALKADMGCRAGHIGQGFRCGEQSLSAREAAIFAAQRKSDSVRTFSKLDSRGR
jgi:hypothetical protein